MPARNNLLDDGMLGTLKKGMAEETVPPSEIQYNTSTQQYNDDTSNRMGGDPLLCKARAGSQGKADTVQNNV